MPHEILLVPAVLLALVFLAALAITRRPPEGHHLRLDAFLRRKSHGGQATPFYNAFGEQTRKFPATRFKVKVPGNGAGWSRHRLKT